MKSISARLLTGTAIVMAVFVLLTGLSVSYSVKKRAETALFDRLQGLVYGILGATEIADDQTLMVNDLALPDQRLNSETSGLYAELIGNGGQQIWESKSVSAFVPKVAYSPIGEWVFERIDNKDQGDVHRLQLATVWELDSGEEIAFIVHVVADAEIVTGQLRRFDRTLWSSLLASAVVLLLLQLWILTRSMQPLYHIGTELHEIEQGTREKLDENVPRELKPLASSINLLLISEKNRHQQYRHLLDDLAHCLKTPLSVLKNLRTPASGSAAERADQCEERRDDHRRDQPNDQRENQTENQRESQRKNQRDDQRDDHHQDQSDGQMTEAVIAEQTTQMQSTIDRYLQRAAMQTPQYLAKPVSPLPVINKLCDSLSKIYASPAPRFTIDLDASFQVRLADVDLFEVLGNVLDNACKYGGHGINISADTNNKALIIDDDGPGFPSLLGTSLLERGARADTAVDGQGMGLAASQELMQGYGGDLQLDTSPAGGARVVLHFS